MCKPTSGPARSRASPITCGWCSPSTIRVAIGWGNYNTKSAFTPAWPMGTPKANRNHAGFLVVSSREGYPDKANFKPNLLNRNRRSKVPALLNTASLNSGHNWHFTARWMGEPPGLLGAEVDVNQRYRRASTMANRRPSPYATTDWVMRCAASACVPGLFSTLGHRRALSESYRALGPMGGCMTVRG